MRRLLDRVKGWLDHRYRRTTLLIVGSLSFIAGVLYALHGSVSWEYLLPAFFLLPALGKRKLPALTIIVYGCFIAGLLRGQIGIASEAPLRQYLGSKITIEGVITDDGYFDSKRRVTFNADVIRILEPEARDLSGSLRINTFVLASATRGDIVRASGKIYPTVGNVSASMGYADVETIGTSSNFLDFVRRNFSTGLRDTLPEPNASLGAGIVVGQRSSLTPKWEDILRDAGLTHIIVASGYNLTILVRGIRRLLGKRGSRYQVLLISLVAVSGFALMTGLSPSMLRALIVVFLMIAAWYYGRKLHPLVLLALSAALSVAIDPFQLWRSVGWYLSFCAFFGVIVLAPLLVPRRFEKSLIIPLAAESFAAGIMTLPIIASVFGKVSVVSILANLLVAPIIPAAMALSALAGLSGWLLPEIGAWIALPANWTLTYITDVANLVSRLPGARVDLSMNAAQIGVFYFVLCIVIWCVYKRRKPKPFVLE